MSCLQRVSVRRGNAEHVVFSLIDELGDRRDESLADLAWEGLCAAILTDAALAATLGPVAAAVTLRAASPELDVLTPSERALLGDWLDRLLGSPLS